jgi:hypothetical protein
MTDRTERRPPQAGNGHDREGQEGMQKEHSMTDRTERRPPQSGNGHDREGQEGMQKGSTA